jgi:hypothetical protein
MRSKAENLSLKTIRILLMPVALFGIFCIWVYVLLTLGFQQANNTITDILDL